MVITYSHVFEILVDENVLVLLAKEEIISVLKGGDKSMNNLTVSTEIETIIKNLDFMFADFSDLSSSEKFVERIITCRQMFLKEGLCDELDYLLESFKGLIEVGFISIDEFGLIYRFIVA